MVEPAFSPKAQGFHPDDVLADRFRIVRFLARGGVGEVYEAEDLTLRVPLAIKTLRPEVATHEQVLERFRREILLGRRVTHPNVCRVFDVFHHRLPNGAAKATQIAFITMELLHGQSLADRIHAAGALSTAESLPILRQLAAGLDAAHRAGVVHRDFKSANVVLVPSTDGVRAVITDFGLARRFEVTEDGDTSLTGSGGLVGTVAYMAPEQVEGGDVSAATDIYAFGVVIYEMVTGRKPFSGESALATALRRLSEPPAPPRALMPGLEEHWEANILSCMERDPARRPSTASEVVEALAMPVGPRRLAAAGSRRRHRMWALPAASLAVLLGTTSIAPHHATTVDSDGVTFRRPARPAVAVLGFRNLSERADTAWLSTALTETLRTELDAGAKLRALPGEDVARMKMDLALNDMDSLARNTLHRVRVHLGADLVVLGSYLDLGSDAGGRVRLDVRVQDASSGETVAAFTESGTEERIFDLLARTGAQLRRKLGVSDAAPTHVRDADATTSPSTAEALRLYSEGVARLRLLDALEARRLLRAAVVTAPSYTPAWIALSEASSALGYQQDAFQEARQAFRLSEKASREERLHIEGRYCAAGQEWDRAVEVFHTLWRLSPDDPSLGLRMASCQTAAGRPRDALVTIERLRRMPRPAGGDPRIDIEEAEAARALADYRRMQIVARAAAEKGQERGARLIMARALGQEGSALQQLGRAREAEARLEEARHIYETTGDRGSLASTLLFIGIARRIVGEPAESDTAFHNALTLFRQIGHRKGSAQSFNMLGLNLWKRGQLREALRLMEQAQTLFWELNDRQSIARTLNNRGLIYREMGDLARAAQSFEQGLALGRDAGNQRDLAILVRNMGTLLAVRGDLAGALLRYQEALAIDQDVGHKSGIAADHYFLAELLQTMGRSADAQKEHGEALALREEIGEKLAIAESRLALGMMALEDAEGAMAESLARQAGQEFARQRSVDNEILAQCVLAQAQHAQDKTHEARETMQAADRGRNSQARRVRLLVSVFDARLRAASGRRVEIERARRSLQGAIGEARRSHHVGLELEARLALAEIGAASRAAGADATLAALAQEASAKGYGLIAKKASAARLPVHASNERMKP